MCVEKESNIKRNTILGACYMYKVCSDDIWSAVDLLSDSYSEYTLATDLNSDLKTPDLSSDQTCEVT